MGGVQSLKSRVKVKNEKCFQGPTVVSGQVRCAPGARDSDSDSDSVSDESGLQQGPDLLPCPLATPFPVFVLPGNPGLGPQPPLP